MATVLALYLSWESRSVTISAPSSEWPRKTDAASLGRGFGLRFGDVVEQAGQLEDGTAAEPVAHLFRKIGRRLLRSRAPGSKLPNSGGPG